MFRVGDGCSITLQPSLEYIKSLIILLVVHSKSYRTRRIFSLPAGFLYSHYVCVGEVIDTVK